jgi:uncharacterized membrane protein YkvA (DUF1232 family)
VRALLVGLGIALGIWLLLVVALVAAGRRTAARELATLVPNIAALFGGLLRDRRVPGGSKVLLAIAIAWIASPIDLIPEFIPIAGPLDDAIVAALVLRRVLRRTDQTVLEEHWRGEPATLEAILRLAGR